MKYLLIAILYAYNPAGQLVAIDQEILEISTTAEYSAKVNCDWTGKYIRESMGHYVTVTNGLGQEEQKWKSMFKIRCVPLGKIPTIAPKLPAPIIVPPPKEFPENISMN